MAVIDIMVEPTEPTWTPDIRAAYDRFLAGGGDPEIWAAANPELPPLAQPGARATDAENYAAAVEAARALGKLDFERKQQRQAAAQRQQGKLRAWETLNKVLAP
jgi:hypothetical protein